MTLTTEGLRSGYGPPKAGDEDMEYSPLDADERERGNDQDEDHLLGCVENVHITEYGFSKKETLSSAR